MAFLRYMDTLSVLQILLLLLFLLLRNLVQSLGLDRPDAQHMTYFRGVLLQIGFNPHLTVTTDTFPEEIVRNNSSHPSNSIHHKRKVTKRGRRRRVE